MALVCFILHIDSYQEALAKKYQKINQQLIRSTK